MGWGFSQLEAPFFKGKPEVNDVLPYYLGLDELPAYQANCGPSTKHFVNVTCGECLNGNWGDG